ncbi:Oidioi.mRNA.OKI2018_I69.chr2.g4400.t1.cds [Oikopleura dioica]|uniref:Oidioi.mRNA.OKI2018_I69.chr2.g4400.t1.cds n=1 Tax=Oikopleura dioica TaxID=34765 RepID=A0ABN7T0N4_OIKDI|nr:Oidioi.mRNA.OKI2018_I69.chr2.g4400.t1.cds [Oikopleura dioica]
MKLIIASIASASAYSTSYASADYVDNDFPADATCGGIITGSQLLLPPQDENGFYYKNMNCVWKIQFPESVTSFHIFPNKFAVEKCDECLCDAVILDDGAGNQSSYCGWASRRRREAETALGLESRTSPPNHSKSGMPAQTINGNTGSISFVSDDSYAMRGFEICIYADGDDMATVCIPPAPAAPATLSPAEAWGQIEAAAAALGTVVNDFYAALPGLGANSVLASKKLARFNDFFAKMQKLNSFSSADACNFPAGSNDHSTFVSPIDSADGCVELQGLFASLASFTDSYVCMPDAEYNPIKLTRLIQRQHNQIVTRKLKQMNCGN